MFRCRRGDDDALADFHCTGLASRHDHPSLLYGWHSGFGHPWIPHAMQRVVTRLWNPIACLLAGHHWMPDFQTQRPVDLSAPPFTGEVEWSHEVCSSCSKRRPNVTRGRWEREAV